LADNIHAVDPYFLSHSGFICFCYLCRCASGPGASAAFTAAYLLPGAGFDKHILHPVAA
jgi:hypothetical protein